MRILVVGGYGVGLSFFTERPPADGETVSGARFSQEHGGKASNQAVGVARLGIPVSLLTAVGSDWYAHAAREMWAAEGVDASAVVTKEGVTMVGAIITDATGENRIILANGVLDQLSPADIGAHAAIFESADTVLISCEIPAPSVARAITFGRAAGARVILNPAPVPRLPEHVLRQVDVITPNETEALALLQMLGNDDAAALAALPPQEKAARIAQALECTVVLTHGAEGCYVCESGGQPQKIPAETPRAVVDTTGAGDATNAALAAALTCGATPAEAARFANCAGALTVEAEGVLPGIPSIDDLHTRFGAERCAVVLPRNS
ncbi:ribokinase [Actinotignum timonense]|uniref:ribokinase n=1 Tax=Actinotignum TaxID=1653174 RepID=UPI00254C26FE|nr:ribokinase [Actinotignum timonense]MDK6590199.1 ribokinase [Actinotignum timonense]MDK6628915.1 ribokinase [Actinotignum timonense]MDK6907237.1 ribokinase [Actinotignum timonense]MDK8782562.1 ribokinase [Actinotignum timonense]